MSTFTIALWDATVLANLGYRFYDASGALAARQTSGITQPDATYPVFVITATIPTGALHMVANDSSQAGNWVMIALNFARGNKDGTIDALTKIQAAVYDSATVSGDTITFSNGATMTKTAGNRVTV